MRILFVDDTLNEDLLHNCDYTSNSNGGGGGGADVKGELMCPRNLLNYGLVCAAVLSLYLILTYTASYLYKRRLLFYCLRTELGFSGSDMSFADAFACLLEEMGKCVVPRTLVACCF